MEEKTLILSVEQDILLKQNKEYILCKNQSLNTNNESKDVYLTIQNSNKTQDINFLFDFDAKDWINDYPPASETNSIEHIESQDTVELLSKYCTSLVDKEQYYKELSKKNHSSLCMYLNESDNYDFVCIC